MTVRVRSAWMWLVAWAGVSLAGVSLGGCECGVPIGNGDGDGGADARRAGPRTDECGNGLDDDENGLIDDLCPCAPGETQRCFSGGLASNEVGACRGGTQTCVASGSEWGDWGESECDGEVLPATEACDGSDADCDGAIDEGCPCTDGESRACGEEFLIAPCMAGTQTCRGGSWSGCEGAIGPTADVCTDAIDNDCDGLTNELCACVPAPEVCRDGVDNDCDGLADEMECTPDWPRDAGVPLDAACGVTGCTGDCTCTLGAESDFGPGRLFDGTDSSYALPVSWGDGSADQASAWNDRDGELALLFTTRQRGGDPVVLHLERWTPDGRLIGAAELGTLLEPTIDSLRWAVDHYELRGSSDVGTAMSVPFWWVIPPSGDSHTDFGNGAFTTDMAVTHPLAAFPFEASPVILQHDGRRYAVWSECHELTVTAVMVLGTPFLLCTRHVFFGQGVTSDLRPSGPRTTLLTTSGTGGSWTVVSTGSELAIATFRLRVDTTVPAFPTLYMGPVLFVSDGSDWVTVEDPPVVRDALVATRPALIADEDRILSCYARASGGLGEFPPLRCRLVSRTGVPIGEPFDASVDGADPTVGVYPFRTGCGFAVMSRQTYFDTMGRRRGTFGLSRIDPDVGFVDSQRLMPETTRVNELFAYRSGDDVAILRYETVAEGGTGRVRYQMYQRLFDCP